MYRVTRIRCLVYTSLHRLICQRGNRHHMPPCREGANSHTQSRWWTRGSRHLTTNPKRNMANSRCSPRSSMVKLSSSPWDNSHNRNKPHIHNLYRISSPKHSSSRPWVNLHHKITYPARNLLHTINNNKASPFHRSRTNSSRVNGNQPLL